MIAACAVALVLLLDASGSVTSDDWRMQLSGTADGLADEGVGHVIERQGGVAVTAIAFSDQTVPLMGWRMLRGGADARAFARELAEVPRPLFGGTRLGEAVDDALQAFDRAPCQPEQEVIDVATDGDADPAAAHQARDRAAARGTRGNAIGIGRRPEGTPADWLRENAVTPGGFAIEAESWPDFARAMRRKLTMELAAR